MKLSLVVQTPGKGEGKVIPITLPQFLIGRDPQCHLRPASAMISKRHCALLLKGEQAFVRDFDSTNGTFLNDEPIKGEVELHHEDKLRVGPLNFLIQLEATPAAKPAAASKTPAPATKAPAAVKAPAKAAPEKPAEPPPAPKPVPERPAANAEDDLAAILLLEDDGGSVGSGDSGVPEGSTVFDVPAISGTTPEGQPVADGGKEKAKEAKKPTENSSDAARAILEKYMRRPRT